LRARALAAQGREAELQSHLDEVRVLPRQTYWSYGAALVAAGQEFQAHGSRQDGEEALQAAARWLEAELETDPTYRGHRFWLAEAYYSLGAWTEAEDRLRALVEDFPERAGYRGLLALATARVTGDRALAEPHLDPSPQYSQGDQLTFHARLAFILGDEDRGLSLLNEAIRSGVDDFSWLHSRGAVDFESIGANAQFVRLMSPRTDS
ncbi:MAG: tetratricopeptide repeat protein, partial [Longimicrobiales bacterium]